MKKLIVVLTLCSCFGFAVSAWAQQVDIALADGTISAPGPSGTGISAFPSMRGGNYFGFNGDVLFMGPIGVEAEVNWRTSQGSYGGVVPYRPIFYDFNAIYSKTLNHRFGAEVMGGIGAASTRFYTGSYNCDYYGNCTNYVSTNHFLVDFGGGVKMYAWRNLFVRPEMRFYYIVHNTQYFSSDVAVRYGASIGYTFGGSR